MTTIPCPQCGTGVIVSDGQVGAEILCATCGQSIVAMPAAPHPHPPVSAPSQIRIKSDPPDVAWAITFLAAGPIIILVLVALRSALREGLSGRPEDSMGFAVFCIAVMILAVGLAIVTAIAQVLSRLHILIHLLDEVRSGEHTRK